MSWYGPQDCNCECDPCPGTYTILDKYMANWAPLPPPKQCMLTWLVEVSTFAFWRVMSSDGLGGPRSMISTSTLSGTPGGESIVGAGNVGVILSMGPPRRSLLELELKWYDDACPWFKIDECWFTLPVIGPGEPTIPCIWQYLPDTLSEVDCTFAGDVNQITVTQPATSVTVSGYTSHMTPLNGTFSVTGDSAVIQFIDSIWAYWHRNYYWRRVFVGCSNVSVRVESQHYSASYPGYPVISLWAWNSKNIRYKEVTKSLKINRFECVTCDPDCMDPTIIHGIDGTKETTTHIGIGTPPPGWPLPSPNATDGVVTINI